MVADRSFPQPGGLGIFPAYFYQTFPYPAVVADPDQRRIYLAATHTQVSLEYQQSVYHVGAVADDCHCSGGLRSAVPATGQDNRHLFQHLRFSQYPDHEHAPDTLQQGLNAGQENRAYLGQEHKGQNMQLSAGYISPVQR